MSMQLMHIANILVAGWIGIASLFFPSTAATSIFTNAYQPSEVIRLVGCMWLAIAIISILGLVRPVTFSPIFLVQLIYKASWLMLVALPAIRKQQPYPSAMAIFFAVWVVVLPFVIPWRVWLKG